LSALVEGRQLDDDATVLLEFDNGAKGVLIATQIAAGEENALRLRVYGETGGLEWRQEEPNSLIINSLDESKKILRTGVGKLSPAAAAHTRIPAGHPEGFLEAFANIYRNVAKTIQARLVGEAADPLYDFPSIADGVRGMYFIERVVVSAQSSEKWTTF
jgi:predicted dehydrogenase